MVNIPHLSSPMEAINNLLLDSTLPSKADMGNLKVTILLLADLLRLSNPTAVTSSSHLLHSTTVLLLDLPRVIMELLLLTSNLMVTILLRLRDLPQDSTARLPLSSMAHHQSSLLPPHSAMDHLRSSNGMVHLTLTAYERP